MAKAEAERKEKEERKAYRHAQVEDKLESLNKVVESYEKETGEKLEYLIVNGKLTVQKENTYIKAPYIKFSGTDSHEDWWNRLYNAIREV